MKTSLTAVALAVVLAMSSVGCVSQRQYDELDQAYRKSQEQVAELQARIDELNQRIKMLEQDPQTQAKRISELMRERDELLAKLRDLEGKYNELAGRMPVTALGPQTDAALRDLASRYPDLLEYDPNTGMIRFKSDVTFALGSADLTARAREVIGRLAPILNGPEVSQYEVRVVGHTDSMAISRAETRSKHPTNWFLSVHRAISVRDALETSGVPALRTSVGGYSMYRPVVANKPGGTEQNRRVELYLVPMSKVAVDVPTSETRGRGAAPAAPKAAPKAAPAPATPRNEIPLK
jgi:chemotaxis protein MotB